ncbi:hypothetical protein [Amycolatopsis sp. NPDC059657]|uniref:hypothetical protein n=1 Tax=Amycolatopsis sp. NPDC059657 TaxID=3346899 RepID=UPI003671630E
MHAGDSSVAASSARVEPDEVQLVGCALLVGTGKEFDTCAYEGGYHHETFQGLYRVDVYEAQTAKYVGSFHIDGKDSDDCSPIMWFSRSTPPKSTTRTALSPPDDRCRAMPAPFVGASL